MKNQNSSVIGAVGINKIFKEPIDFHVLKDITFDIQRGDLILGENRYV